MPIRFKLVIFAILCSVVPLLVVFSTAFNTARSAINETVEQSLIAQAKEELYIVQRKLVKAKKEFISMGELGVMQNMSSDDHYQTIQLELRRLASSHPEFIELHMTDIHGKIVASTKPELIDSDQYSTWQHRVARLGLPYDGPIESVADSTQRYAKLSVPIHTVKNKKRLIGVLMGTLDWNVLQAGLSKRSLFDGVQGQQRQVILQSSKNSSILYSTSDTSPPEALLKVKSAEPKFQRLMHGDAQYMTASIVSTALDEFRNPDWRFHVVLDADIAYASVHELRRKFITTGVVVMILVSILGYLLARSIVSPVISLVNSADRLASGDYDHAVKASSSKDEIGQLATSFQKMSTAIQDNEQKLITEMEISKQAAKLKGEFLANMSHEVRTPINGVLGMTELLLNTNLDRTQSRYASTISRSGQSLLSVINDILDFSKIEAGKLELQGVAFDLRDLVEDCVEMLAEGAHSKDVEIALHMDPGIHVAYQGDANRLRQVVLNLMGNAVKFTSEGEVKLVVTCKDHGADQSEIRFEVIDTGIGIKKEALDSIFGSFVQADGSTTRQFGGTGLGLAISAKLAELMEGTIGVQSEYGSGSNFWFTAQVEKLPSSVQETWRSTDALAQKRILIVDDNYTNCEILQSQMKYWSAEPVVTNSGQEALRELDASYSCEQPFDVVILDMHMPGMNGMELAVAIRERTQASGLKLVLLSSVCDQLDLKTCKSIGINSLVTKPVRQPDLYNCLTAAIGDTEEVGSKSTVQSKIQESQLEGRVLIAEDNPVNQDMMLELLRLLGTDAVLAENGQQAIDAIEKEHFDVVIMDCQMPELDGFAATRAIRKREQASDSEMRIPIVALTANALQGDREKCLACGMDEYLSKPVNSSTLRTMLSNWLPYKASQQDETVIQVQSVGSKLIASSTSALEIDTSESAANQTLSSVVTADQQSLNSPATDDQTTVLDVEPSEPVLDPRVIGEVLEMAAQAPSDFYGRLVAKYEEGSKEDIVAIAAAIENQEPEIVSANAHRLKSSSANWGAKQMAAACQSLELAAKDGSLENAKITLQTIESERERVLVALSVVQPKAA